MADVWNKLQLRSQNISCMTRCVCVCVLPPRDQSSWEFHFHEVIILWCALYLYTWLVPVVLSSLLWWRGSQNCYSLLELLWL